MRKALNIYTEYVYELLLLLIYKVFLLGVFGLFSLGIFLVANTFTKLPLWGSIILFFILAKGIFLSFIRSISQVISGKKPSIDEFTFYSFVLSIRGIPILITESIIYLIILVPVILTSYFLPFTLSNPLVLVLYIVYAIFALFITKYLTIWAYILISVYDINPISAIRNGLVWILKHPELFKPYTIWFISFLTIYVPLLNFLTYFTLYPVATINLLLSFKSSSLGRRMPL